MISPDYKNFRRLASKGNLVAVRRSIPADLDTPVSVFLKLAAKEPNAFLLESAEQEEKIGRYSFIGFSPSAVFTAHGREIKITGKGKQKPIKKRALIDVLETTLRDYKLANPEDLPAFCGGLVGYLSYENVQDFETVRLRSQKPGPGLPDGIFFLTHDFLIFDHFLKTLSVVTLVPAKDGKSLKTAYAAAAKKMDKTIQKLRAPLRLPPPSKRTKPATVKSNTPHASFVEKVGKIREYIKAGDCIQVVLSQRFILPPVKNDFQIYRALRTVNPSPYMFYFRAGRHRLIGSSPELLVKKTGSEAEVRPIAGTRPRGKNGGRLAA
jgi:anthranilate synthase component I